MRGSIAAALAFLFLALAPAAHAVAPPSAATVDALEQYFLPSVVGIARGGIVTWTFANAASTHTATDDTGILLYDSGLVHPRGPSFSFAFTSAGSYPFVCTLHVGMDGRVEVPLRAAPATGSIGEGFTVTWSSVTAPGGFVFDVQMKPKAGVWGIWQDGVSIRQSVYVPSSGGSVRFRGRYRQTSSGETSGWSAPARIVVR